MAKLAEPKREGFLDPWNDHTLLAYYKKLYYWHGFLRFLGLPHLEDNPDVPIESLYVEPKLSQQPISPDEPPENWPSCTGLLQALKEHPRLVILGDPGLGKSSLVNWVVHQLTRMEGRAWRQELGDLVPIPMILRELPIDDEITWDRLVQGFLERPVGEPLRGREDLLRDLIERGQVLFLLDGIDELGATAQRKALRGAVFRGVQKHPACQFLLTSRVVGYDEVPLDYDFLAERHQGVRDMTPGQPPFFDRRYLAPFDDEQIEWFVRAWYGRREGRKEERESTAQDLLAALRRHESTEHLARVPNLLTLMALIFRIQLQLPDGRALLYDKIAEAYLESIDRYRGMAVPGGRLKEKKRWLAKVGFEMQLRRQQKAQERSKVVEAIRRQALLRDAEILVDQATVERWLAAAMQGTQRGFEEMTAATFLDYVGRRSGLLLPRGEGHYAFTHLSFQEYFAAVHMAELLRSPKWPRKAEELSLTPADLARYADSAIWREPLIFLFELLADDLDWPEELPEIVFGQGFSDFASEAKASLLTQLVLDPHTGWADGTRLEAARALWRWELSAQGDGLGFDPSVVYLASASPTATWLHRVLPEIMLEHPWNCLLLLGAAAKTVLSTVGKLPSLEILRLMDADIRDLRPLSNLQRLEHLILDGTHVEDLRPLENLHELKTLHLRRTQVHDLRPLENLHQLQRLDLGGTRVHDLRPLGKMHKLQYLSLIQTPNQNLSPIHSLKELEELHIDDTVPDFELQALAEALPNLKVELWVPRPTSALP